MASGKSKSKAKEKKISTSPKKGIKKLTKARRAGLTFPPTRFQNRLKAGNFSKRIGVGAGLYMAAIVEYLCAEILELAGNAALDNNRKRVIPRHIMMAVRNDDELNKMLKDVHISDGGVVPSVHRILLHTLEQRRKLQDKGDLPSDEILSTQVQDSLLSGEEVSHDGTPKKKKKKSSENKKNKKKKKSQQRRRLKVVRKALLLKVLLEVLLGHLSHLKVHLKYLLKYLLKVLLKV